MSDLSSLLGPTGSEKGSESKPPNSATPGNLMELKKSISDKFLSGDYQGAWDAIMSMTDEQKMAAVNDDTFKRVIRRVSIETNQDISGPITAQALGVKSAAGAKGGKSGVNMGGHNYGDPISSHPKPEWVKRAEERTGTSYIFSESLGKWVQNTLTDKSGIAGAGGGSG